MKKLLTYVAILIGVIVILGWVFEKTQPISQVKYGVSFSPRYARYLKLDWQKVYIQILDDLKVKKLRLPSYWTSLQPDSEEFDFSETDFMLLEAEKRGVEVILVVGARQPRWPECHIPDWAKNLSVENRQQKTLEFVQKVVERYKGNTSIKAWQVENEPFVNWFGEKCEDLDSVFLQKEIALVKKLDPKKPIVITESGEWSFWNKAMKISDILGISLYRKVHNPIFGNTAYPIPSFAYHLKSDLIRKMFAPNNQKTILSELQAEPWFEKGVLDTSLDEQIGLFSLEDFKSNVQYAQKTGFNEVYLWGIEWWYWISLQGHTGYLDFAKTLFE